MILRRNLAKTGRTMLVAIVACYGAVAKGATPPEFTVDVIAGPESVAVSIAPGLRPTPAFEVAPAVVDASDLLIITTGWSWICHDAGNLVADRIQVDERRCARFSLPARIDSSGKDISSGQASVSRDDWRRSYYGVFSAFKLPRPFQENKFVALLHGENKNEQIAHNYYANTVNTWIRPNQCASGYKNGQYEECWKAYNAFVGMKFFNGGDAGVGLDIGPVLWPSAGYTRSGTKLSSGVRHPSAILWKGFIYIYYLDTSRDQEAGRHGGLTVARMPVPGDNDVNVPAALAWYNEQFSNENPSLPRGFDRTRIRDFYGQPGGRSQELWAQSWQTVRFSVAKLKGTPYLLGVEEYSTTGIWGVRLRISADGIHWGAPINIPSLKIEGGWNNGILHYPTFMNERGTNAIDIAPDLFYIVGIAPGGKIVRYRLSLQIQRELP